MLPEPHFIASRSAPVSGGPLDGTSIKMERTRFEHADPILSVRDMNVSVRYYVDVLGFANAPWGSSDFTVVSRDGACIYLCRGEQGNPGTWAWVGVEDAAALYREYQASGARIRRELHNQPWALEFHVEDPDGHVLRFGSEPLHESPSKQ